MNRREFVSINAGLAGAFASQRRVSAQTPKPRTAVVIGVDKVGALPKLKGAAAGARQVDVWLRGEGFDTALFTDETNKVRVNDIYDAVANRINRGTVEQLVIYFAGHGFISSYSEFWMLSNAPENPNEAVSLRESIELAKASAVPNVTFISDACRSRADSLGTERVRGSLIFPNRGFNSATVSDVDVFLATLVGDSSFEVPVATSAPLYEGIYTASFLSAFSKPDGTMVRTLNGVRIVPNNRMKAYLDREVRSRAEAISIQLRQVPDTQVVSGDNTYIGQVRGDGPQLPTRPTDRRASIHDVASIDLARVGIRGSSGASLAPVEINRVRNETGYASATAAMRQPTETPQLERVGGVAVIGTRLKAAVARKEVRIQILPGAEGQRPSHLVRVELNNAAACSIVLQFEEGGGTVVAGLRGYVANVTVRAGRVDSVMYVPAPNSDHWFEYANERARFNDLQATVATAARFGVFRIEGSGKANREQASRMLADRIRVLKGIDPTLGLYAAYAYSDAGILEQVRSVRSYMRGDLNADIFDVAMLAGDLTSKNLAAIPTVFPFCPMLSQGWNLLRIKDVRITREVNAARDHLRQALWTTFDRGGVDILLGAVGAGRLQ